MVGLGYRGFARTSAGGMRRFDQEHFHRFVKGHLGLGAARLDAAEAVDGWIALVLAAYTQLYLARNLVDDLRRPWQARPPLGTTLSPYRVRFGFRRLRGKLPRLSHNLRLVKVKSDFWLCG
jgi:hypothetical protein